MTRKEAYKRLCTLEGEPFNDERIIDLLNGYAEDGLDELIFSSPDFDLIEVYINSLYSIPFLFVINQDDNTIISVIDKEVKKWEL